jgi:hypothetical protein
MAERFGWMASLIYLPKEQPYVIIKSEKRALREADLMPGKTKKATFSLHTDVITELDTAISRGQAPSKNALVERALIKELSELQRQERLKRWQEGARDPLLLKDLTEMENAFKHTDIETMEKSI